MIASIKKLYQEFYNITFPRVCMSCLEEASPQSGSLFCVKCFFELPFTDHFTNANNDLVKHFYGKLDLNYAASLMYFTEGGAVQSILHNFKYKRMIDIGIQLGILSADKLLNSGFFGTIDAIIPVPLHQGKLFQRGFNQSEVFGRAVAKKMKVPIYDDVLLRNRYTETQTKKSRSERIKNVNEAFEVHNKHKINEKNIVLVDDVITTGATMISCVDILKENGVNKISILSIAKAIKN